MWLVSITTSPGYKHEITLVRKMWNEGISIIGIAKVVGRHLNEVAFLIMDQADQGYIKARKGGVLGEFFESKCD